MCENYKKGIPLNDSMNGDDTMKKGCIFFCSLMLIAVAAWADSFQPQVLTLKAPEEIAYAFDGSPLSIPLTVEGTPAAVWLIINTKGKADQIKNVRNGHLGWHYVNKIDTTVYVSGRYQASPGENTIVWDGLNMDGAPVAPDDYSYYFWGYDDMNPRQLASYHVRVGFDWESPFTHLYEVGENGLPLDNPLIMGAVNWSTYFYGQREKSDYLIHGTHFKWMLGNDPRDAGLLETTICSMYRDRHTEVSYGGPVFDPNDFDTFYHCSTRIIDKQDTMLKWKFVPEGEAVLDNSWLGWDRLTWDDQGIAMREWSQKPSAFTDRQYIYVVSPGLHQKDIEWNRLRCVSFDGKVIFDKQMHDWYMPNDQGETFLDTKPYINASFNHLYSRGNNRWLLLSHISCMHQMIDTTRLLENPEDETDMVVFENGNGDYWMDSGFKPGFTPAWICLHDIERETLRRDSIAIDANGFNVIGTSFMGVISFGVSTQDGTAIDYMSFADDIVGNNLNIKGGGTLCDSGSNFDGLYFGGALKENTRSYTEQDISSTWFVAFDSVKGVITAK